MPLDKVWRDKLAIHRLEAVAAVVGLKSCSDQCPTEDLWPEVGWEALYGGPRESIVTKSVTLGELDQVWTQFDSRRLR